MLFVALPDISPACFQISMSITMLLRICTAQWVRFRLMNITRSRIRPMASRWLVLPVICIFIISTSNNLRCSGTNPKKHLIRRPLRRFRRCRLEEDARALVRNLDLRLLMCHRVCQSPLRASWPLLWRINLNNWWVNL